MLFTVLFALAVLDALANGPTLQSTRPYVLAGISVVVILLSNPVGFVLAEFAFVIAYAEAAFIERKKKKELELAVLKPKAAVALEDNALPTPAQDLLRKAKEEFTKNISGPMNAHDKPWRLLESSGGVSIYQSDFPNQKCKFWKVETEITGNIEIIKKELMDYDLRCKWDAALQKRKGCKNL